MSIKVLRDTGARHSFILDSVLPFSSATETGDFVLMRGIGMELVSVPRHKILLENELVRGAVTVGVRPALPIDGVSMILGNDLAGSAVWAVGPPSPVVTPEPVACVGHDESGQLSSAVFCSVTRAQGFAAAVQESCVPVPRGGKRGTKGGQSVQFSGPNFRLFLMLSG